ncbi:secreted RxLR effector protein 161-like [Silene latifolia]|uniref:secreted RxLR effector protein 161-like n=1 Tax=Silene latifolia TaxID=37657 RepID=UPI003D772712
MLQLLVALCMLKSVLDLTLHMLLGVLGRYQSNPCIDHWEVTKKVLRYLQGAKDYMLMYRRTDSLEVVGYSDSDFVGWIDSRKSTLGYVFMLDNGDVFWWCIKQTLTTTYTMEAEFVSYFEATSQGMPPKGFKGHVVNKGLGSIM